MVKRKVTGPSRLEAAREKCVREVMKLPGVTMVSEGEMDGTPCIVVYLEKDDRKLRGKIPSNCLGIPVRVEVSGEFKAF